MNRTTHGAQLSSLDTQLVRQRAESPTHDLGASEDEPTLIYVGVPRVGVTSVGETDYGEAVVVSDCKPEERTEQAEIPMAPWIPEAFEATKAQPLHHKSSARWRLASALLRRRLRSRARVPWRAVLAGAAIGLGGAMGSAWGMLKGQLDAAVQAPHRPDEKSVAPGAASDVAPDAASDVAPDALPKNAVAAPPSGASVAPHTRRDRGVVPGSEPKATPRRPSLERLPSPRPALASLASGHLPEALERGRESDISRRSRQALVHQIEGRCQAAESVYEGLCADAAARQDLERLRLFTALRRGASRACGAVAGRSGVAK